MTQQMYGQPYYPRAQQMSLRGYPVSSIEEARAASIEFDGNISYFPDLSNQRIYTKQINMDGTASFNMYQLTEIPIQKQVNMEDYVSREEFLKAISDLKTVLSQSSAQAKPIECKF